MEFPDNSPVTAQSPAQYRKIKIQKQWKHFEIPTGTTGFSGGKASLTYLNAPTNDMHFTCVFTIYNEKFSETVHIDVMSKYTMGPRIWIAALFNWPPHPYRYDSEGCG